MKKLIELIKDLRTNHVFIEAVASAIIIGGLTYALIWASTYFNF